MATTAPGEFSGFNHLHHHHHHHSSEQYYRHEHYHHHFHHPSYDSPFSTVSYTERVGSVTPPNAVGFHFLGRNVKTVGEKREKSEEKRPGTPNLLPPIGDALLRCDIQSDHTKKRLAPSDENAATETCAKYILQQNELHNINELGDLSRSPPALTSKDNSRKKSKSPKMSTDVREDYNVKTENDPNDLLFPFSSRGFGIFGGNGTRVSDDVTSLISAPPGTVEAFFRSETSMSSTAFQPSDRPSTASSNDAPSYVTLTPLQPLPPISTVAEKHGTGSGSNYSALDQQQQQQEQQQQQQQQQHEKMDLNGYSKLGGMGDSLPPLSNHMLLNTLAAQSRTGIQSQVAIEAANQAAAAAAAVGFSHYNNKPLSSNILPPPAPPSNPYDSHVFGRLEQCNDMTTTFPPRPVFSPRQPFAHQYASHPVSELDNSSGSITSIPRRGLRSGGCQNGGAKNRLQGQDANNEHPPAASLPDPETKITTQQLALKITQALKQHSIPQAVFAQIVLQRSQGTLSDLLRNPKPWHKLKSGKETFKRMWVWLHTNEPHRLEKLRREAQEMRRDVDKPEPGGGGAGGGGGAAKRARLVFNDEQRRRLKEAFKECARPSKEQQNILAEELNLSQQTVSNFFMNSRRRSDEKWGRNNMGCKAEPGINPQATDSCSSTADHHLQQAFPQPTGHDVRLGYPSSAANQIGSHLHFTPSHLHHPGLQQHHNQQIPMLGHGHLASGCLTQPYQTQHQLLCSELPHHSSAR